VFLVEAEVESGPQAARDTRERISGLQNELGPDVHADLTLLASELVTNAYRHSGTPKGDPITLRVSMKNHVLRVEVEDRGDAPPGPHLREPDETGGWGLQLVSTLSDRWGIGRSRSGNIVWFELAVSEDHERSAHG
jgi:anti-sigma regulatory factor (Ser/Thr protein kinase)